MKSVIFMGTPQFAAPILSGIIKAGYEIKAVVTQPDRKVGRKKILSASPVKQVALKHDLKVLQPAKLSQSQELLELMELKADFIITAAYGQFLPTKLLKTAQIAAINVHGSLLPKYRGGAPVQYALKNGDKKTGVSIIYMVKQMDAGDILATEVLPITKNDDTGTIFEKMSLIGRDLLLKTLPKLSENTIIATKQNEQEVVFAPTIKPNEESLSLMQSAKQIDWQIRAFRPAPGAYFANFNQKRTKIWDVTVLDEQTTKKAGTVVGLTKHELKIAAANGSVYCINELQPAGKPRLKINDYLNGVGQNIKLGQVIITDDK